MYKIGEVQFRLLGKNGFHAKAKNERFTAACSPCRQNLKNENFTSSFSRLRHKNCTKKRAARAGRLFPDLTNQIIDLWRCRGRCRRHFLNSLL